MLLVTIALVTGASDNLTYLLSDIGIEPLTVDVVRPPPHLNRCSEVKPALLQAQAQKLGAYAECGGGLWYRDRLVLLDGLVVNRAFSHEAASFSCIFSGYFLGKKNFLDFVCVQLIPLFDFRYFRRCKF